jgi:predicted RNase H-like HicB family nuclease
MALKQVEDHSPGQDVVIFWSDEDDSYIAEDRSLPGCCAFGPTELKAAAELEDARASWLIAKSINESRAIERLSRSIESEHAYMSEAEWEADTIARMRRQQEQQRQGDGV